MARRTPLPCLCGDQKLMPGVCVPLSLSLLFCDRIGHLTWGSLFQLDLLLGKLSGFSCLPLLSLGLQTCITGSAFYVCVGDLHSDPHVHAANTFLTELFSQIWASFPDETKLWLPPMQGGGLLINSGIIFWGGSLFFTHKIVCIYYVQHILKELHIVNS